MNVKVLYFLGLVCVMQLYANIQELKDKVFLTILARNKAHMLPYYLLCIDQLDYDKQLMTVYINTNNNSDDTEAILREWAIKNKNVYKEIIFESHCVDLLSTEKVQSHHYICNEKFFGWSYNIPVTQRENWTLQQEKVSIDDYFTTPLGCNFLSRVKNYKKQCI